MFACFLFLAPISYVVWCCPWPSLRKQRTCMHLSTFYTQTTQGTQVPGDATDRDTDGKEKEGDDARRFGMSLIDPRPSAARAEGEVREV